MSYSALELMDYRGKGEEYKYSRETGLSTRHSFFQLCDIQDDEIQELIQSARPQRAYDVCIIKKIAVIFY